MQGYGACTPPAEDIVPVCFRRVVARCVGVKMNPVLAGVVTVLVAALATGANAAQLRAETDSEIYAPGATVTITLTGRSDPYDEMTTHIDVRIVGTDFTEVSTEQAMGGTCLETFGCLAGAPWAVGGTQGDTVLGNYQAFNQIGSTVDTPITNNMDPSGFAEGFLEGNSHLRAVFTTTAGAEGTYQIDLSPIGTGFFDVAGPMTLATYTGMVPEPSAGALMGLGVLVLGVTRRRTLRCQRQQGRCGVDKIFH